MNIVQATLVQKGHHHTFSFSWWDSFRKRHPDLNFLGKAEVLSHPRYVCCTSDTINRYFDLLEEALDNNGLRHLPSQIFNCDESGFSLDPPAPNVIVPRGTNTLIMYLVVIRVKLLLWCALMLVAMLSLHLLKNL